MQQVIDHARATGLTPPPATQTTNGSQQQPNAAAFVFRKAVKQNAKLRLALSGPGGSGKTYTLLKLAAALGGRIAAIDTEHGSLEKYADQFEFDVLHLDSYNPAIFPRLIGEVAAQGYSTLITDSWSHFWMGEAGNWTRWTPSPPAPKATIPSRPGATFPRCTTAWSTPCWPRPSTSW